MAEKKITVKAEDTISVAEAGALFFRTLVNDGVPVTAAISITGQYITAVVLTGKVEQPPAFPWEEKGE